MAKILNILYREYNVNVVKHKYVIDLIVNNWLTELENGGSHLTEEDVAYNINDILTRYRYK